MFNNGPLPQRQATKPSYDLLPGVKVHATRDDHQRLSVNNLVGLGRVLPRGFVFSFLVYLLSRVPVIIGITMFICRNPGLSLGSVAVRHDGWWYERIARLGYTTSLRPPLAPRDFHHRFSDWAFYPGYPLLIRCVHELTRFSYPASSLILSSALGFTSIWAMYALGDAYGGVAVARSTALLMSAWPGSMAFSLPYSEGLFVTCAALALTFLHRQRWRWVGMFGAAAIFTRPTGLAVLAAITVVAAVHLHRERNWRPLAAAALTICGGAVFVLYGWARTGDALIWRHAENLWSQRLDLSTGLLRKSLDMLTHPRRSLSDHAHQLQLVSVLMAMLGFAMLLLMGIAAARRRQWKSPAMVAYAVTAVAMILGYSSVGARPRMVLAVLPGFVWLGVWLPRKVTIALSAVCLVLLGVLTYLWSGKVAP